MFIAFQVRYANLTDGRKHWNYTCSTPLTFTRSIERQKPTDSILLLRKLPTHLPKMTQIRA